MIGPSRVNSPSPVMTSCPVKDAVPNSVKTVVDSDKDAVAVKARCSATVAARLSNREIEKPWIQWIQGFSFAPD